jgi:hypothetical protein
MLLCAKRLERGRFAWPEGLCQNASGLLRERPSRRVPAAPSMRQSGIIGAFTSCEFNARAVLAALAIGLAMPTIAANNPVAEATSLNEDANALSNQGRYVEAGYTTCLRSCSTALNSIAAVIDRLGKLGALCLADIYWNGSGTGGARQYPCLWRLSDPAFLFVTGSSGEIEQAAKSFRVKLERIQL